MSNSIADANAFRDLARTLPQHQAALTLLQARLSAPTSSRVRWLDLACGRAQIIGALDENFSDSARANVEYWGYDINERFARETWRIGERLGFASMETTVGDIAGFAKLLPDHLDFDFITLTNALHEVSPLHVANVLIDCVSRLSSTGTLFIYDMETLQTPELGAVPWTRDEARRILWTLLDGIGADRYRPEIGLWHHRLCNGWNVQLERGHIPLSTDALNSVHDRAVTSTAREIIQLLSLKLHECKAALEMLTRCGPETAEEEEQKQRLLFDYWALTRAVEACG